MTIEHVVTVLNGCPLQGTKKLLLVAIANHDGDGGAFPGMDKLTRYASVDRRNVQRALREMETDGWLTIQQAGGGTRDTPADRRPNRYVLNYDRMNGAALPPPRRQTNGAALARERGGAGARNGAAHAPPEPPLETPMNHPLGHQPSLLGSEPEPSPAAGEEKGNDKAGLAARARAVVDRVWETKSPKPATPYIAAVKITERLLTAGHTQRAVYAAMMEAPTLTVAAVELQLGRQREAGRARPNADERQQVMTDRNAEGGRWRPSGRGGRA